MAVIWALLGDGGWWPGLLGDGEPATGAACLSLVVAGVGSHACQQINHARNAIKYKKIIQSSPEEATYNKAASSSNNNKHSQTHTLTHTHSHVCTKINARKPPTQKSCPQGVCVMLQQAKDSSMRLCVCVYGCVYACVIVSLFL